MLISAMWVVCFFPENLSRKKHYLFSITLFKTNPASVNPHSQVKTTKERFKKERRHVLSGTEIKNFVVSFKSSWKLLHYLFFSFYILSLIFDRHINISFVHI